MKTAEMDPDNIRPWSAVYTQDGHYLGEVGETEEGFFQVRAPMQPVYWLPLRAVAQFTDDQVSVAFYLDQLIEYRRLSPAA